VSVTGEYECELRVGVSVRQSVSVNVCVCVCVLERPPSSPPSRPRQCSVALQSLLVGVSVSVRVRV